MRPQPVASCDVHVSSYDLFKVGSDSRVGQKVARRLWAQVDEQVNIAVAPVLVADDGTENRDVRNPALPKFHFVSPELREDARQEGHTL